jgi:hypothetical protein
MKRPEDGDDEDWNTKVAANAIVEEINRLVHELKGLCAGKDVRTNTVDIHQYRYNGNTCEWESSSIDC